MESLASTYILLIELKHGLERGDSTLFILRNARDQLDTGCIKELAELIEKYERNGPQNLILTNSISIYRDILYQIIVSSLRGEPVLKKLAELEIEVKNACDENMDHFIANLPVKVMLPILLLQFPAFLILVIGPILAQFLKEIST